jgi:hypothetical protein
MIYYEGEKIEILYQVLQNEFKRKYGWDIQYKYKEEIVLTPKERTCVLFKIHKKTTTIIIDGQMKTINNSYCRAMITNIYKYYFQFLITNFIKNRPTKIHSLFSLSFFQLDSSEIKYYTLY